jgi:L-2-hydroxyglutarate oxidase LhgO
MDTYDCAVIGAGVVGLAVARALALKGREVIVLESAGAIGTGTSSRNSEVIHAGIYYPQDSLKARLCVEGKALLYDYLVSRNLPHRRCGKLIVATRSSQLEALNAIVDRARLNGVDDLVWLDRDEARRIEPALECVAALHSPSTGILDSHAFMLSLQGDLENAGGVVALRSAIERGDCSDGATVLIASDGTALRCKSVVNAAGLHAPALVRSLAGFPRAMIPVGHFAKGNYFTLAGRAPFSRLIYPVPEPGGLGVHLTLDLGGQAKFGPDVQWVSSPDDLVVDPARGESFYEEVRRYWPGLTDGALQPGYAGIRPKLSGPGDPACDFMIQAADAHGVPGLVNLFGIESPGLTSSLAIAQHVAQLLEAA